MSSWAIVIGIDDYADTPLPGSTTDAMRVCAWLTRDGGPVPLSNVYLCLSPQPAPGTLPPAIANVGWLGNATMQTLNDAMAHLWRRPGDDVYVYFAGHGAFVPGQLLQQYERVLLASDFGKGAPIKSIKVSDLLDAFAGSNFTNQFFLLDACADKQEFRSGIIPAPPVRDYTRHVNQFVLHATSPGSMAAQVTQGTVARGVYTDALMDALTGSGTAKRYDYKSRTYRVQWSDLATYLIARVKRQAILPTTTAATIQWPVEDGQHDDSNPVLAAFPADHFAKVTLAVSVDPTAAGAAAKLEVLEPGKRAPIQEFGPCTTLPVPFALDPRMYFIAGSAAGYVPVQESWPAELYEDGTLTVAFTPGTPPPPPPPPRAPEPLAALDAPDFGPRGRLAREKLRYFVQPDDLIPQGYAISQTTLEVETDDPLAHVDIVDLNGQVVAAGEGKVASTEITPGAYYARCRSAEGAIASRLVNVIESEQPRIQLAPPATDDSPAMKRLIAQKGFTVDEGGNLHVSELVGPIASGRLSTVLALAGVFATYPDGTLAHGKKLRSVGLTPLAETGVSLAFADEQPRPAGLALPLASMIRIDLAPMSGTPARIPLRAVGDGNVIAEGQAASAPGPYWLTVSVANMLSVRFAIRVVPDHVTFLVFSRVGSGDIGVFQYFLPTHPTPTSDDGAKRTAQAVRELELVERRVLAGLFSDVTNPEALVDLQFADPMQILFGGYLTLRARISDGSRAFNRASQAADWLIKRYADLPDGYVIRAGIAEALSNTTDAAANYAEALTRGLPIFIGGLARLSAAIERYDLTHSNREIIAQVVRERVPSSLWPVHAPSAP